MYKLANLPSARGNLVDKYTCILYVKNKKQTGTLTQETCPTIKHSNMSFV